VYAAQASFEAAGRAYVCNLGDVPRVVSWGLFHPSLFLVRVFVSLCSLLFARCGTLTRDRVPTPRRRPSLTARIHWTATSRWTRFSTRRDSARTPRAMHHPQATAAMTGGTHAVQACSQCDRIQRRKSCESLR
jgi:hypothetical protein